ncbi:GNAT family N-acetyltransferase [Rhodanobacter caeni]|uniref:N-acetyltransferase domain-containing protein n=1 Tax=Rhodanobacter caeni TaxID=657654 RepID=A0ABN0UFQ3_9GAMM
MTADHSNRSAAETLRVVPVQPPLHRALLRLRVRPAQRDRVGAMADLLADVTQCPGCEPMAIMCGDAPIGYYRIDPGARSVTGRDFAQPARGLRSLFVDEHWQGCGIGTRALALLLADLAVRHPSTRLLVLTVDDDNAAALRMYRRAGFVEDGARYHGGRCGSQRLLLRALP